MAAMPITMKIIQPCDARPKRRHESVGGSHRNIDVQRPDGIQRQTVDDTAIAVDRCGNAVVRSAHERQARLDGAELRLPEMLIGSGRVAEPGIVGDVDEQPRIRARRARDAGKDRLRNR